MALPDMQVRKRGTYDVLAVLIAAATITASANGTGIEVGKGSTFQVAVDVRGAVSGTDQTLDVKIEESDDNSTYTEVMKFPQIDAAGRTQLAVQVTGKYVRAVVTIGGTDTPSFGDTEVFVLG